MGFGLRVFRVPQVFLVYLFCNRVWNLRLGGVIQAGVVGSSFSFGL